MSSHPHCSNCMQAYNALNGRYCTLLKRYVEHSSINRYPQCITLKK